MLRLDAALLLVLPLVQAQARARRVEQDGILLAASRLVIPGDRRAGRAVRNLVAIEVH